MAEREGRVVGSLGLHPQAALRRRHAAVVGISVDASVQGQGVGTARLPAGCDFADQWGQLLRNELMVFVDNLRAQALRKRSGFRQ